jgi:hypothetical protein
MYTVFGEGWDLILVLIAVWLVPGGLLWLIRWLGGADMNTPPPRIRNRFPEYPSGPGGAG